MKKLLVGLLILVLGIPFLAQAQAVDVDATVSEQGNWYRVVTLCSGQADTGVCTTDGASGSDRLVLDLRKHAKYVRAIPKIILTTDSADIDCTVYMADAGYDATNRVNTLTTANIIETDLVGDMAVRNLDLAPPYWRSMWAECGTLASPGSETVTLKLVLMEP